MKRVFIMLLILITVFVPTGYTLAQTHTLSGMLSLSLQKRKQKGRIVITIKAGRQPLSSIRFLSPIPVKVQVWDEQDKVIKELEVQEWQLHSWTVPYGVRGNLTFLAMQTDQSGKQRFGKKAIVAHRIGTQGKWQLFRENDGLGDNFIGALLEDKEGAIWVGTNTWAGIDCGLSRYDGKTWVTYTTEDGLADNWVRTLLEDKEGVIWAGTIYGGINRYDGRCFQTLDSKDGLVNDSVSCLCIDESARIWIGTEGGLVRFVPNKTKPPLYITQIIADKEYTNQKGKIKLSPGVRRISLKYHAISYKTRPGRMKFFYQLVGRNTDWQGPTNQKTVEYFDLKPGEYTFKAQAVDRDLNYSKIARLDITILPPPFYTGAGFIIGAIFTVFLIPTIIYALLLVQQRRQQGFEPIPNPYIVGNPIRGKEMFFGREDDFQFVSNKLKGEQKGTVIVFCGERRSGKTSILYQIMDGRLGENFVPVLIDMQGMAVQNVAEFYDKLADAISACVGENINHDFHAEGVNPSRTFEHFLDDIMAFLEGKSLLLLFDEYELLEVKITQGILTNDIITFFASILERYPNLSFIFTGSRRLEQRPADYWHRMIPKSIYRKISFLSQRDALRLITEPVTGTVSYQREILERIYRFTAGQPFYIQVICQNLLDRLNGEERNRILPQDVDAIVNDLSDNPLPQMIYFWEDLTGRQRIILALLAEILDNPASYITVKQIIAFGNEHVEGLQMSESEIQSGLDELCDEEILDRERAGEGRYEYRYKVDLFRHWVRRGHSIWQLLADG